MSDVTASPSRSSFWLSALGIIGCFLVFLAILYVAYLPSREQAPATAFPLTAEEQNELAQLSPSEREIRLSELRWSRGLPSPADRQARLADLRHQEARALQSYAWIDQGQGIVRLPITRAIELTVAEHRRPQSGP